MGGSVQLSRYSYWLRAGRSGDRNPVEARFSAPVQTSSGSIQSPLQLVAGLFHGGKAAEACRYHPPSRAEVKERVEL